VEISVDFHEIPKWDIEARCLAGRATTIETAKKGVLS